ncbi:MAG: SDR family NAD(P)-dependent oxidoreductase [Comamonadaceae bacterium]|nr:SDR family NAD(P)-dependent oxidoreductase [Comamonadaceae bacterium]
MARRDFSGKVILITGAAGGLGAALCHRFAAAGAHIAAMDLDATRLQDLVAALPAGTLSIAGNIDDPPRARPPSTRPWRTSARSTV